MIEIDRVVASGTAYRAGVRPGMRILAIGDPPKPVHSLADFESELRQLDVNQGVPLVFQSPDGQMLPLKLGLPKTHAEP